jgi:hypothetical protein
LRAKSPRPPSQETYPRPADFRLSAEDTGPERLGLAASLGKAMGATVLRLEELDSALLVRLARERAADHA